MDSFPSIYWINMDRSHDRRERMENMFKDLNISNHFRISGVNGRSGEYSSFVNFGNVNITGPEKGCTASHLRAIDTALSESESDFIVLEDDIDLTTFRKWYFLDQAQKECFQTAFKYMLALAPDDMGYIHLSQPDVKIVKVLPHCFPKDASNPRYSPICGSSTAILYYKREYAQELQKKYKTNGHWDLSGVGKSAVADFLLNTYPNLLPEYKLKRYCFPVFVTREEDESTIGNDVRMHQVANDILLKVLEDPSRSSDFSYLNFIPSSIIYGTFFIILLGIALTVFFIHRRNN